LQKTADQFLSPRVTAYNANALLFCAANVAKNKVGHPQRAAVDRSGWTTVRHNSPACRRATQSRRENLSLPQTDTGAEVTVLRTEVVPDIIIIIIFISIISNQADRIE